MIDPANVPDVLSAENLARYVLQKLKCSAMRTRIIRIDESSRDYYLDRGGMHGSELDGRMTTTAAYDENVAILRANLATLGKNGIDEDCSYFIEMFPPPDFFPCVEVSRVEILTPNLIRLAHDSVASMDIDYRVDVCNSMCYLDEVGAFNFFVERDVIYAYAENGDVLNMLGLNDEFLQTN